MYFTMQAIPIFGSLPIRREKKFDSIRGSWFLCASEIRYNTVFPLEINIGHWYSCGAGNGRKAVPPNVASNFARWA